MAPNGTFGVARGSLSKKTRDEFAALGFDVEEFESPKTEPRMPHPCPDSECVEVEIIVVDC
jgi:hypothetical protein